MNEVFINRLTYLLNKNGMKPADLSRKTNIRASSISDWLTGKYTPKQDKIAIIADAFGVSAAWLMGYENNPNPISPLPHSGQDMVDSVKEENPQIIRLARLAKNLPEEDLKTIVNLTELLAKKTDSNKGSDVDDDI